MAGAPPSLSVMHLENVVFDAVRPRLVGRFWETVLGTEQLTDDAGGYETRLALPDGPVLDLGFQQVPQPPVGPQRLRFDLRTGEPQRAVERLLALGASPVDRDRGAEPPVSLVDPEGNPFRVVEDPSADAEDGPVAALSLAVADPARERDFWSWLTGWAPVDDTAAAGLRHPSRRGPVLELRHEEEPKGSGKNRVHLDVRLEVGEDPDDVAREIADRGGRRLEVQWGDLPWRSYLDPSGNEFCVLPASR